MNQKNRFTPNNLVKDFRGFLISPFLTFFILSIAKFFFFKNLSIKFIAYASTLFFVNSLVWSFGAYKLISNKIKYKKKAIPLKNIILLNLFVILKVVILSLIVYILIIIKDMEFLSFLSTFISCLFMGAFLSIFTYKGREHKKKNDF